MYVTNDISLKIKFVKNKINKNMITVKISGDNNDAFSLV